MITSILIIFLSLAYILGPPIHPSLDFQPFVFIQGILSIGCLAIGWKNHWEREKAKESLSSQASPLFGALSYPSSIFSSTLFYLLPLASFIPLLLYGGGIVLDIRGEIFLHSLFVTLFFDFLLWRNQKKEPVLSLNGLVDLTAYRDLMDGTMEAAFKGVEKLHLTQATTALSFFPHSFPHLTPDLEYRVLYLLEGLETLAKKGGENHLFSYSQAVLTRMIRLSGSLLDSFPSLGTCSLEGVGRVIKKMIDDGHQQAGERGLFLFVQAVREVNPKSLNLGDYLIKVCLELEKGLESLFRYDKGRAAKSLVTPIAEIKRILTSEPFIDQPGAKLGLREIDRIGATFMVLDKVMSSLSSFPPNQTRVEAPQQNEEPLR